MPYIRRQRFCWPNPFTTKIRLALTSHAVLGFALCCAPPAHADPEPVTINGMPQQVLPQVPEIGLGNYTPPEVGSITIGSGSGGSSGSTGGGTTGGTDSSALTTMDDQSWGQQASSNAEAVGVNPSAVAATCVIESQCQNVQGSGTVAGAFQMTASTFNASIAEALAENPSLAEDIVPGTAGQMDPATESIAAAQYLKDAAYQLQNAGVSNPTVLDTRAVYNFGPQSGALLATANDDADIADVMPQVSAKTLAANGITAGETVGEWRASVSSKIGNAASQTVLLG